RFGPIRLNTSPSRPSSRISVAVRPSRRRDCRSAVIRNTGAGRQWKRELINRTSLTEDEIGEYSGEKKEIRPVTIATYQVITR
ncbi:hypothetical protein BST36_30610, partial [Mycolicibacterium moriokaense]